jgi:hypothetical protein
LIGSEGTAQHRDRVNRRAAGEQSVGLSVTAVVGQSAQHGIAGVIWTATVVPNQVVGVRADGAVIANEAIRSSVLFKTTAVAGDDGIAIVQQPPWDTLLPRAFGIDAAAVDSGTIVTDSTVDQLYRAFDVDAATVAPGTVTTDGAIDEFQRTVTGYKDASTVFLGTVAADSAVDERQRPRHVLNAAAVTALLHVITGFDGGVVPDGAVDECQRAHVQYAATGIAGVVADYAVLERQRAFIRDAAARVWIRDRVTMPDRQRPDSHCGAVCDQEHAVGGAIGRGVGLYSGAVGPSPLNGDAFIDYDACFSVDGVGHADDVPWGSAGVINGGLDGGEIAAGGAYSVARGGNSRSS